MIKISKARMTHNHECVHPVSSHNKLEYNYAGGITVLSLTIKGSTR